MTTIISEPIVTGVIIPKKATIGLTEQKVLFVGQKTAVGTAVSGVLRENVLNDNAWDAETGENSMMAGMVRAYRDINAVTRLDYIPLDDGAGNAATGTIVFTGPSTEAGAFLVTIGSEKNHTYVLDVALGDTATVMGDNLEALIVADTKVPATAVNAAGTVTATAVNVGLEGNFISIKISGTVAGVTTATTAMTGGTGSPTLTGLFDVVDGVRYQTVVMPQSYGLSILTDFLDPRFNVENDILDGIGVVSITDTFSNILATVDAENSQSLGVHANKLVDEADYRGSALLELDTVIAAKFAAIRSLRLTEGANVSDISIAATRGFKDAFGGIHMSSLPYHNTPIQGLPIGDPKYGFEPLEIRQLNDAGAFVIGSNRGRTQAILGKVVTTYKTDAASNEDDSFKTFNQVDQLSAIREYVSVNQKKEYAQSRLTSGDLKPGYSNANAVSIRAFNVGLYKQLGDVVVVRSGDEAIKNFKETHNVEITDLAKGEVFQEWIVEPVSQLRAIRFTIQPTFSA